MNPWTDTYATPNGVAKPDNASGSESSRYGVAAWLATANGNVTVFGALLAVAFSVAAAFAPDSLVVSAASSGVAAVLSIAAVLSSLLTSRHASADARTRQAWFGCAIAVAACGATNARWIMDAGSGPAAAVTWLGILRLAMYPAALYALLRFRRRRLDRTDSIWLTVDAVVPFAAGATAIWLGLVPASLGIHTDGLSRALLVGFPLGDLLLLVTSAVTLHCSRPVNRVAIALLGGAFLCLLVADYVTASAAVARANAGRTLPVLVCVLLAAALWLIAAQYQRWVAGLVERRARGRRLPWHLSALPCLTIVGAFAVLFEVARPQLSVALVVVVIAITVMMAVMVARQVAAIAEIRRLLADRALREARFSSLVRNTSDVITVVDQTGRILFLSPSAAQVYGWRPDGISGSPLSDLVHPEDHEILTSFLGRLASRNGATSTAIWRCRHTAGDWRHAEVIGTCLLEDPAVGGIVLNSRDVSERTALERELTHQAHHDALTDLANRVRFRSAVERALNGARGNESSVAVMFLDLDKFKFINDSMGHAEGDRLLIETAARLLKATRGSDLVARLGGDEFAVLLEQVGTKTNAIMVAERIISAMAAPFALSAADVNVAVSIGIAHAQAGQDADQILQNADVSMYSAKRHWPGRYVLFEPHMQEAIRDRLALEADLRRAIDRDELTVQYQPIIALDTGRIAGVEALVRWHHPVRGALSPADFIPLAEECGLVVPLGRAVLARACRDVAGWRGLGGFATPFHLAVNVSGKQLHASLADEVRAALDASGLPAEMLLLEITEREVMRDTDATLARLSELKALGVRLAIDDFGTGYSSLAYLQRFPIDVLKIDKSFVSHLGQDAQGTSLARTIVALGDALSLRTVAEGVEHGEQATVLRAMGCDCAQGYLFSRPVDGAEMPLLLARAAREPLWPDTSIRAA